jgi:hypothetical protein
MPQSLGRLRIQGQDLVPTVISGLGAPNNSRSDKSTVKRKEKLLLEFIMQNQPHKIAPKQIKADKVLLTYCCYVVVQCLLSK